MEQRHAQHQSIIIVKTLMIYTVGSAERLLPAGGWSKIQLDSTEIISTTPYSIQLRISLWRMRKRVHGTKEGRRKETHIHCFVILNSIQLQSVEELMSLGVPGAALEVGDGLFRDSLPTSAGAAPPRGPPASPSSFPLSSSSPPRLTDWLKD